MLNVIKPRWIHILHIEILKTGSFVTRYFRTLHIYITKLGHHITLPIKGPPHDTATLIFKIMCLEAQGSDTFYGVVTMIASRQAKISSGLEFFELI